MTQLVLIPVYAFSEKVFKQRYEKSVQAIRNKYSSIPENILQEIIDYETFPQRSTPLNHVIGYITISVFGNDMYFDVYLPLKLKRYIWTSRQRNFIQNILANGTHFNYTFCKNNKEIQDKVVDMINLVIKEHIPSRFFVDTRSFFRLNCNIDYYNLIKSAKEDFTM